MLRTSMAFSVILLLIVGGCGGGKNDASTGKTDGGGGQGGSSEGDASTATDMDSGTKVKPKGCGDKVVQAPEECDDGNGVDNDGCDTLCKYNCKADADCTSKTDVCSGGTMTCDVAKHMCIAGEGKKANGESCGDNAWCYEGKCYALECGNGIKQGKEECDDGNSDDADGCTKKCYYTCGSETEVGRTVQNMCDPEATCDATTHKWIKGKNPIPDGQPCKRGTGYCSNGVCVLSVCGDGTKDPNEQCDDGADNGKAGKCSKTCTIGVCGNKIIEQGEECDDGNATLFDGCDERCKAEVTFRATSLTFPAEDAPSYCAYANTPNKGNAFKNLFPVDPSTGTNAIADLLNSAITDEMTKGDVVAIFQGFDVDDYSGKIPDPSMSIGISMGQPQDAGAWPTDASPSSTLDIPILAYKTSFENDQPKRIFNGETVLVDDKPVIRSTALLNNAGFDVMGMSWVLSNLYVFWPIDPTFSRLPEPPATAAGLKIPESVGNAFNKPYTAILCGAFAQKDFAKIPLIDILSTICIDQFANAVLSGAKAYQPCTEDNPLKQVEEGRCDSFLTVFQGGCSALGIMILNPIGDPDVDIDGDGKNDAYSVVLRASAQRARLVGLVDPPDFDGGIPDGGFTFGRAGSGGSGRGGAGAQ